MSRRWVLDRLTELPGIILAPRGLLDIMKHVAGRCFATIYNIMLKGDEYID